MKFKGYRFGVKWIAENDEPSETDPEEIKGFISTCLLADLCGYEPEKVAADIVREREKIAKREAEEEEAELDAEEEALNSTDDESWGRG